MLTKLQQLLAFLPEGWDVPASYLIVAAVVALVMWVAFKIAMRLVSTLVGTAREARKLAMMMSGFTGGGAAIPLTAEQLLAFLQNAF